MLRSREQLLGKCTAAAVTTGVGTGQGALCHCCLPCRGVRSHKHRLLALLQLQFAQISYHAVAEFPTQNEILWCWMMKSLDLHCSAVFRHDASGISLQICPDWQLLIWLSIMPDWAAQGDLLGPFEVRLLAMAAYQAGNRCSLEGVQLEGVLLGHLAVPGWLVEGACTMRPVCLTFLAQEPADIVARRQRWTAASRHLLQGMHRTYACWTVCQAFKLEEASHKALPSNERVQSSSAYHGCLREAWPRPGSPRDTEPHGQ